MSRAYIVTRNGGTVTKAPINDNKIPIYANETALDADLANIPDNTLVATKSGHDDVIDQMKAYIRDQNELSDYENVEIQYVDNPSSIIDSVTPTQFTKMDYDGVLLINSHFSSNNGLMGCYLKNFGYLGFINIYGGVGVPVYKTLSVRVKKNDEICLVFNSRSTEVQPYTFGGSPYVLGRFYKKRDYPTANRQ